jgi:hypothetical protein
VKSSPVLAPPSGVISSVLESEAAGRQVGADRVGGGESTAGTQVRSVIDGCSVTSAGVSGLGGQRDTDRWTSIGDRLRAAVPL